MAQLVQYNKPTMAILFMAILCWCPVARASANHFQYWYPQWSEGLQTTLQDECSGLFRGYIDRTFSWCDGQDGLGKEGCYVGSVVDCVLGNLRESWKADMASAAVLLGFIPTILALAGPSTVEIGLLSLRRPFLAVLLGCATPAITSIPTFEHKSPIEVLQKQQDSLVVPKLSKMSAIAITVIEYICACAAIGNVAYTSWQLGISSVCSFAPGTTFLPILWNFLAPVIYLFGVYAVVLRTKFSVCEQDDCEQDDRKDAGMFTQLFRREFQLCSQQPQATLTFQHESYLFVFISMLTSMATVVHLTFGTVVFSSTLFVGTGDAIKIACRYFASTAACQAILMFEINGLRQTVNISEARTDEASYDAVSDGAHSQNCPTKLPGQYLA